MNVEVLNNPLIWAAVAVLVIVRQFVPRAVRPASLVVVPVILALVGLQSIARTPPVGVLALGLFAVDVAAAVGLGLARGASLRIWQTGEGVWMRQGTVVTLVLWVASLAVRVGLTLLFRHAVPVSGITLLLGLTFGAQSLVLWLRTQATGSPVPQPDEAS